MKTPIIVAAAALAACGCIQVKTESEIKPIHITMDVNLKVDKDLDKAFADEDQKKPKGNFKAVKEMVDRQAAGLTRLALLEAREGATDDDRLLIAEENASRMKRFSAVAKSNRPLDPQVAAEAYTLLPGDMQHKRSFMTKAQTLALPTSHYQTKVFHFPNIGRCRQIGVPWSNARETTQDAGSHSFRLQHRL